MTLGSNCDEESKAVLMFTRKRAYCGARLVLTAVTLWLGVLGAGQAVAGGLLLY
jgi:hypothetical protein